MVSPGSVRFPHPLSAIPLSKHRIEAFADGVFAIVVTLLVLEIHPPDLSRQASDAEILHALREIVFPLFSFVITFVLASAFRLLHHTSYRFIEKTNRTLLWINIGFLMFVSLLPFSTAMLGRFHLETSVPRVVYFSNLLTLAALAGGLTSILVPAAGFYAFLVVVLIARGWSRRMDRAARA